MSLLFLLLLSFLALGSGDAAKGNGERTAEGRLRALFVGEEVVLELPLLPPSLLSLLRPLLRLPCAF